MTEIIEISPLHLFSMNEVTWAYDEENSIVPPLTEILCIRS